MKQTKGRFRRGPHPEALAFSTSLPVDRKLYREDIEGSLAHLAMLAKRGIVPAREAKRIARGLQRIRREIEAGRFVPGAGRFAGDDIHLAIESRLINTVGEIGGKLHTARSRNDQIAVDVRLYLRREIERVQRLLRAFQKVLVRKGRQYSDVVMPGYTHLQRAQPVLLAHHLLAYVEMLERDSERFVDCRKRVDRSPLGAGALAGTSFPIDRQSTSRKLGFSGILNNSIDAVSDRDVLIEFIGACAITMMHLSRMAEELVLWSSQEWRFVVLDDAFTTGSSIMPQKKNPDMAELVRGKTGRVYGDLVNLLTVMKGLPLAYNRDMQEDKEPTFDAAATVSDSLRIMALMLASAKFERKRFEQEMHSDFLLATELAEYLARKGAPFRKSHTIVGAIVRECEEQGIGLADLPLDRYRKHSALFARDLYRLLDPRSAVSQKRSAGSTSPREVQKALTLWTVKLA
jgi:argininosuccinate lyase